MKNWLIIRFNDVAAYLASEDDDIQASFFATFAKELRHTCETSYHTRLQMSAILILLSDKNKETLYFHIS